jgi:hypothetical protein
MADQVVANAAQIAAAKAQEAARINALAKAQADVTAVKSSATKLYGTTISPIVKGLTAGLNSAIKDLNSKNGNITSTSKQLVSDATALSKSLQPTIATQITD